ncbi:hypothetical protein BC827DRAFT_231351 [Russula dissimulans]|nr:hypothetical protein BC827DRAFT_231351 [Russula dissimulans]
MSGHRLTTTPAFLKHAAYIIKVLQPFYTQSSFSIGHQSYSGRGGQNLSERFRRLEKMLSAKHILSHTILDPPRPLTPTLLSTPPPPATVTIFRGLVIPQVPKAPESDECCMSGCAVCVHDIYQESIEIYNSSVEAIRASLTAMNVPMEEWPESICPGSEKRKPLPASSISTNAFQEMERLLKARREAQAQTMDVHLDYLEKPSIQKRRRHSRWKELDLVTLYEGLRWVLFSNR